MQGGWGNNSPPANCVAEPVRICGFVVWISILVEIRCCSRKGRTRKTIYFFPTPICWFLTWFYWCTSSNSILCLQYEVESPSLQGFKIGVHVAQGTWVALAGRKVGLDDLWGFFKLSHSEMWCCKNAENWWLLERKDNFRQNLWSEIDVMLPSHHRSWFPGVWFQLFRLLLLSPYCFVVLRLSCSFLTVLLPTTLIFL